MTVLLTNSGRLVAALWVFMEEAPWLPFGGAVAKRLRGCPPDEGTLPPPLRGTSLKEGGVYGPL